MHKQFYASGFLLHPASGQILLQTAQSDSPYTWKHFSAKSIGEEKPFQTFQRAIIETLDVSLSQKEIKAVYDYDDEATNTHRYVFYGILDEEGFDPDTVTDESLKWFRIKQLSKLSISPQDKQDIIVAERVINAEIRENMPPETNS